jgi:predicted nuclease with TOPRIM domain
MNSAKIWILITGIILMASGFVLYSTIKSRDAEKAGLMAKIQELNDRVLELTQVQAELVQLKKEKAELEAESQANVAALESQISEDKKTEMSLRSKIDALTKEKESLSKYMENNSVIVSKLQKKIESLEQDKKEVLERARQAPETPRFVDPMDEPENSPKIELGAKLAGEEVVDLGRIIIRESTNQPAQVEHVNTLYGFIVLSAGTDDGLRKDAIVNITRNSRLIAKAVIKKVRDNTASAATLPEWTREEIKVGDLISVNSPAPTGRR